MSLIVRGHLVEIPSFGKLNILKDAVIGVKDGVIVVFAENQAAISHLDTSCKDILSKAGLDPDNTEIVNLKVNFTDRAIAQVAFSLAMLAYGRSPGEYRGTRSEELS